MTASGWPDNPTPVVAQPGEYHAFIRANQFNTKTLVAPASTGPILVSAPSNPATDTNSITAEAMPSSTNVLIIRFLFLLTPSRISCYCATTTRACLRYVWMYLQHLSCAEFISVLLNTGAETGAANQGPEVREVGGCPFSHAYNFLIASAIGCGHAFNLSCNPWYYWFYLEKRRPRPSSTFGACWPGRSRGEREG